MYKSTRPHDHQSSGYVLFWCIFKISRRTLDLFFYIFFREEDNLFPRYLLANSAEHNKFAVSNFVALCVIKQKKFCTGLFTFRYIDCFRYREFFKIIDNLTAKYFYHLSSRYIFSFILTAINYQIITDKRVSNMLDKLVTDNYNIYVSNS